MRVAVVGLGGVGGYIAASFAKAGIELVGFARGEHLREIQKEGITIVEDATQWKQKLDAKALREAEGVFDVVLFCVKSYDLRESYEAIAKHISSDTLLISFSNGVNNADILREMTDSKVLDGAVYILSHKQKAGVIRKKGKVFAAVFGPQTKEAETLASLFERAGLRYKIEDDIKRALWKKYIFISAFATLTSYYDKPIAAVYKEHLREAETLLREIAAVAQSKGINIDDEVQKALTTASKLPSDASTSMHLDMSEGRRSELESLSGYIVKDEAVETVLMQKMYEKLSAKS